MTARSKLVDVRDPCFATLSDDHVTAGQAANLPSLHQDVFDRALIAAARRTVLTSDRMIARYGVPVRWWGPLLRYAARNYVTSNERSCRGCKAARPAAPTAPLAAPNALDDLAGAAAIVARPAFGLAAAAAHRAEPLARAGRALRRLVARSRATATGTRSLLSLSHLASPYSSPETHGP